MIDFGEWSVTEAKNYRDKYIASLPARTEWLTNELKFDAKPSGLLVGPAGLDELWDWAAARLAHGADQIKLYTTQPNADQQPGVRPPWHATHGNPFLSDGTLWLIELLGAHLTRMVLAHEPDSRLDLYRAKLRSDVFRNRTVLLGVPSGWADPPQRVYGSVIGPIIHQKDYVSLANIYRDLIAT